MEYLKVTSALVITGAVSYSAYTFITKRQEKAAFRIRCESLLKEQIVDTYPLIRLHFQTLQSNPHYITFSLNFKEQGKQPKSELKLRSKILREATLRMFILFGLVFKTHDLALRICERRGISKERYQRWFDHPKNLNAKKYLQKLDSAIKEIANQNRDEPPATFEVAIKPQLFKKDIAMLAFRKFCDFQKHLLYQQLRAGLVKETITDEHDKIQLVKQILGSRKDTQKQEELWRKVFSALEIDLESGESAEMEFRKAMYRHMFDRVWNNDYQRIENEHYTIMGAVLQFARSTSPEILFSLNPLQQSNNPQEYRYDLSLPFLKGVSQELLLMLCQAYRQRFGSQYYTLDLAHQKELDKIQAMILKHTQQSQSFSDIQAAAQQNQQLNSVQQNAQASSLMQALLQGSKDNTPASTSTGQNVSQPGTNTKKNLRALIQNDIKKRLSRASIAQASNVSAAQTNEALADTSIDLNSSVNYNAIEHFAKNPTVSRRRARQAAQQNGANTSNQNNSSQFLDIINQSASDINQGADTSRIMADDSVILNE